MEACEKVENWDCAVVQNPLAPCNIRRMFPDAKLVVSVRDPTYSLLASINEQRDSCLHKDKSEDPKCCSDHTPLKPWLQRDLEQLKAHYEQCLDPFAQGNICIEVWD